MDIEIYIRDISPEDAIRWMEGKLGPLVEVHRDDVIRIMHTVPDGIAVTITPGISDGPFLSIFVSGQQIPWVRSEELAIPAVHELGRTVRWCDEKTNGFMEKQGDAPPVPIYWDD